MEAFDFGASPGVSDPAHQTVTACLAVAVPRAALVLSSMVRRPVAGELGDLQALSLSELDGPDRSWLLLRYRADRTESATGVVILADATLVALADLVMGGPGIPEERTPTPLEVRLVANTLDRVLEPLAGALVPFGVELLAVETTTREDVGVRANMIHIPVALDADGLHASLSLALPAALFSDVERTADSIAVMPEARAALHEVPVTVAVRFEPLPVAAGDLDGLAIGDVIRLDHSVDRPLVGEVDGRPLFLALPGRGTRSLAVEVVDFMEASTR